MLRYMLWEVNNGGRFYLERYYTVTLKGSGKGNSGAPLKATSWSGDSIFSDVDTRKSRRGGVSRSARRRLLVSEHQKIHKRLVTD